LRTAIIHYWIVAERGGEKVVQALCELFPDAVIFTHVADAALAARLYPGHEIRTTFISRLPFASTRYKSYLPLMPLALEELNLGEFDLVISSESGPSKGVIPGPESTHICYCHSPMRYIWDHYHLYRDNAGFFAKWTFPHFAHKLRQWDVTAAARVDTFVANSQFVAARIEKYYRRSAEVVHPPVDVDSFSNAAGGKDDAFFGAYLWVGQLTAYKKPEIAIETATRLKKKLVVIGDGEAAAALKSKAGDTVKFVGRVNDDVLRRAYASARALVFPGEEDFGMTPVEAMAAGLPVIALNRGGARETVVHEKTGILYDTDSSAGLECAFEHYEALERDFEPTVIKGHARKFGKAAFKKAMTGIFRKHGFDLPSAQ
jgi:glycosyltransferase involved in cell wall biosynthesis